MSTTDNQVETGEAEATEGTLPSYTSIKEMLEDNEDRLDRCMRMLEKEQGWDFERKRTIQIIGSAVYLGRSDRPAAHRMATLRGRKMLLDRTLVNGQPAATVTLLADGNTKFERATDTI